MPYDKHLLVFAVIVSMVIILLTAKLPRGQRMIATSMLCAVLLAIFTAKANAQPAPVPFLKPVNRAPYVEPLGPPPTTSITPVIRAPESLVTGVKPEPMLRWSPTPDGRSTCSTNPVGNVECGPGYWHPLQ